MERKEIGTGQDKGHSPKSRVKSQPGGKSKWKFVLWAIMKSIDWWAGGEQTCKLPLKLTKSTESRVWGVEKQSLKSSIDWQQTLPPLNQWQRPWVWRRKLKKKKGGIKLFDNLLIRPSIAFDGTVVRPNNWRPTRGRKLLKKTVARQSTFSSRDGFFFFYDLNMKLTQTFDIFTICHCEWNRNTNGFHS